MGCDCRILIPSDTRLNDLVSVMAIAAGGGSQKVFLQGDTGSWYVRTTGARVEPSSAGASFMIMSPSIFLNIGKKMVDGEQEHFTMLHLAAEGRHGKYFSMHPPSTPFWVAMGRKVINVFGGEILFDDCADKPFIVTSKKPRKWNDPEDGEPWQKLQDDIFHVRPVTVKDMSCVALKTGYPKSGLGKHSDLDAAAAMVEKQGKAYVTAQQFPYDDIMAGMEKELGFES